MELGHKRGVEQHDHRYAGDVADPFLNCADHYKDLMSGSNDNMSLVTNVASGLDGADTSLSPYNWTCPEVDPYSTIYFYQVRCPVSARSYT